MRAQLALVWATAAATVSNTGTPSDVSPPRPGVTPATTLVPYSMQRCVWKAPSRPVMPWTRRRVWEPTRMLMRGGQETGDRRQETGDMRHATGDRGYCSSPTTYSPASSRTVDGPPDERLARTDLINPKIVLPARFCRSVRRVQVS